MVDRTEEVVVLCEIDHACTELNRYERIIAQDRISNSDLVTINLDVPSKSERCSRAEMVARRRLQ